MNPLRPLPSPISYSYFPTIGNSRSTFSLILPHYTYLYIFLFPIPYHTYPNTLPLPHFPTNILTPTLAHGPCFPLPYLSPLSTSFLFSYQHSCPNINSIFPFHTYPNIHSHPFHPTKICIPTLTPHPYFPQHTYPYVYPIPIPPPHMPWHPLPIPIPTNLLPLALTSIPNLLPPRLSHHQPPIPVPPSAHLPHVKPRPYFSPPHVSLPSPIPMVSPHVPLGAPPLLFPPPDSPPPPPQHPPLLQCSLQWNHSTDLVLTQDLIKLCWFWTLVEFLFSADIKCRAEPGLHSDWRLHFRTQMLVVSSDRSWVFWVDWTESTDAKTPERKTCSQNSWTCWKGEKTFFMA